MMMNHVALRALALNGSRIQSATAVPPRDRFIMMQQEKTPNEEGATQKEKLWCLEMGVSTWCVQTKYGDQSVLGTFPW